MSSFTALYDASVLYPSDLRNLLMHLALTGLFRAKWSSDIHEEWISALLRNRPDLTRTKLERTRMLMDLHATDALVTDYQHVIPGLQLPDANDRHVLAAAIRARADVIVTINLRDFPPEALASFGIEAQHPDEFILHAPVRSGARCRGRCGRGSPVEPQESCKDDRGVPEYTGSARIDEDGVGAS